ncbi:MAG: PAS domain S-box protein, partial [Bacteroidetes bacterium]
MKKFIYLFIYLLNNVIVLFATDTTFVNQTQKEYFIGKKVQYLEDKTNQITFNQLLTEKYINQFKALDKKSFVSSMPNSGAVWFKFILKNNSIEDLKLILSFVKTDVYEADLYFIDKQNLTKHLKTGICLPPEKRAYKSLSPAFPIELLPHETGTFYVRIYSVSFHHLIPNLVEEEHFEEISHNKFAFWGLFYGFILFIFAFNIALYVMFRERKLLYFLGHIFFMILFTSSIDGFLFVYGNILVHWTNGFQSLITTGFFVCFLLLFIKEFLQLRNISKLANRLVNTYAISFLSITVLGLLEQSWGFWLGIFALIPLFFLMLYISYLCYKTNGTANNYLLLVLWIFLILGTLNILSLLSILPLNDITRWNFHLAFGLEILILTSGFIYDLRISQLEYVKKTTEKQSKIKIKNSYLEEKIYQANQNLETKTLQLESILESSPDYIYSFDKDLKLLTANNAALERMKSYGYDFTLGLYFKKIFPKEISDFLEPLLLETLKTEKRISIETRGRKLPNRPSYYYSMTFSPILSKASEVVGVSLFIRDITNPVKIKKRLEENETFLLTIFDSAPDALFLIDQAKFSLERCNSTAMEMFELEEVDMIKAVENGIPLTKEKMQEVYQSIINKKEFITEMRYINRSGRNFWGEIKCSNFIIQKREFLLIRITNIDKRKNAEEHIKYLNRQMKGILENTKDTVFAIDNNYRYIIFNEMHRRRMLYAYKATVKIGDNILDHLKGVPDVDCFKEDTAKALRGEQFLVERNYGEG